MSCYTSIYRYLNEDKHNIYNEDRNIRDRLKYNLDNEYKEKIKERKKVMYHKKKQLLIDETLNEFNNIINKYKNHDIEFLYNIYLNNIDTHYTINICKAKKNIIEKNFLIKKS